MNLKGMLIGIATAQPYYEKPDGYHLSAEHDQIWLHATNTPMTPEAVKAMIDAGWFQVDVEYEGYFKVENYDPEESWTCYT